MPSVTTTLFLLLLAQGVAGAQASAVGLNCPPADSIYPRSTDSSRRRPNVNTSRFVTYVIDSQFVILSGPRDARTGRMNDTAIFRDLKPTDISSISLLLPNEAAHWRTCRGMPVFLILTQSRQWRPPANKTGP
jgi:hypothetical protein